jgi:hypothetical protein
MAWRVVAPQMSERARARTKVLVSQAEVLAELGAIMPAVRGGGGGAASSSRCKLDHSPALCTQRSCKLPCKLLASAPRAGVMRRQVCTLSDMTPHPCIALLQARIPRQLGGPCAQPLHEYPEHQKLLQFAASLAKTGAGPG